MKIAATVFLLSLAAFAFPCLLLAYYSLKLRELESK